VTFRASNITNCTATAFNSAFGQGGGIYNYGGMLLMTEETALDGNSASGAGSNIATAGGSTIYSLPAPLGRWISGVSCRVHRSGCPPCSDECERTMQECSRNTSHNAIVDGVRCQPLTTAQPCEWNEHPELLGLTLQLLPTTSNDALWVDIDYPYKCALSGLESGRADHQSSPQCAGMCPEGNYCDGSHHPIPCGRGNYCPAGSSKPTPCPQRFVTTLEDNTTSKQGCVCELPGYAAAPLPLLNCTVPPPFLTVEKAGTTLRTLHVNQGAWRPGFKSTTAKPCPTSSACLGGITDDAYYNASSGATCAHGLTGAFCQLCTDPLSEYFDHTTAKCHSCGDSLAIDVLFVTGTLVILMWVRMLYLRLLATRNRLIRFVEDVSFRAKLRNAISFVQIVTEYVFAILTEALAQQTFLIVEPCVRFTVGRLGAVYDLRWPAAYKSLLNVLSIINLHLFNWLPGFHAVCLGQHSLESQLWFAALVPFGIAIAAVPIAKWCGRPALPFILGWTFLLYPSISSRGFRALAPCDCFSYIDGSEICFMREDYAVECTGSLHAHRSTPSSVSAAAWTTIAIWAIGVPVLYVLVLVFGLVRNDARLHGLLGVLIDGYKPMAAAWEVMNVVEKLILIGFLSLVNPGKWSQIFFAVLVALAVSALQTYVAPYSRSSDQCFAFLVALCLLVVLLLSLGLKAKESAPSLDFNVITMTGVLIMVTGLVLVAVLAFFVADLKHEHARLTHEEQWAVCTLRPPTFKWVTSRRYACFLSQCVTGHNLLPTARTDEYRSHPALAATSTKLRAMRATCTICYAACCARASF
jgi:hypothetical protein